MHGDAVCEHCSDSVQLSFRLSGKIDWKILSSGSAKCRRLILFAFYLFIHLYLFINLSILFLIFYFIIYLLYLYSAFVPKGYPRWLMDFWWIRLGEWLGFVTYLWLYFAHWSSQDDAKMWTASIQMASSGWVRCLFKGFRPWIPMQQKCSRWLTKFYFLPSDCPHNNPVR